MKTEEDTLSAPDEVAAVGQQPRLGSWIAPFSVVSLYAMFIGSQTLAAIVFLLFTSANGWSSDRSDAALESTGGMFAFLMLSEVLMIALIYGLLRMLRWNWARIGLKRPRAIHLGAGIAAAVPYYVAYIAVLSLLAALIPSLNVEQKQDIGFENVASQLDIVLTFISLVVLPPIVEEIAVRGFVYSGVRTWLPKVAAAFVVSIVFASLHLFGGANGSVIWVAAIDTFILSLVLVWLREKTGNLWAGITLHATKNLIAFLLLYIFKVG